MPSFQKSVRAWLVVACALACAPWVSIPASAMGEDERALASPLVHVFRRGEGKHLASRTGQHASGTARTLDDRSNASQCLTAYRVYADGSFRTLHHIDIANGCRREKAAR